MFFAVVAALVAFAAGTAYQAREACLLRNRRAVLLWSAVSLFLLTGAAGIVGLLIAEPSLRRWQPASGFDTGWQCQENIPQAEVCFKH